MIMEMHWFSCIRRHKEQEMDIDGRDRSTLLIMTSDGTHSSSNFLLRARPTQRCIVRRPAKRNDLPSLSVSNESGAIEGKCSRARAAITCLPKNLPAVNFASKGIADFTLARVAYLCSLQFGIAKPSSVPRKKYLLGWKSTVCNS